MQFHPTALDVGADPMPLLTEALRGEGAMLVDERGRRVLADAGPAGELLPRDVVARALWSALQSGRRAFLDARGAVGESFPERVPDGVRGLPPPRPRSPRAKPVPVAPAAHYHMGGVDVDLDGCTSVRGLWAAGEVACTGVHGANRLASNSLLEGLVFGARVARSVGESLAHLRQARPAPLLPLAQPGATDDTNEAAVEAEIRGLMWNAVGLVRTGEGLAGALARLEALDARLSAGSSRNPLTVARLVATAALARPESRGAHFRADHPLADPAWRRRILLTPDGAGARVETRATAADPNAVEVCA